MSNDSARKRASRERAAQTGESYTQANRLLTTHTDGPGVLRARRAGRCAHCGAAFPPGTRIASYRGRWGHLWCVAALRPGVRVWVQAQAHEHESVVGLLELADDYAAAGWPEKAHQMREQAQANVENLLELLRPQRLAEYAAPYPSLFSDPYDPWGDLRDPEDYYSDERVTIATAQDLLRAAAAEAPRAATLIEVAGRQLARLFLETAADYIRGVRFEPVPSDPQTSDARRACAVLDLLDQASYIRRNGDEEWTYCQELIAWAGKVALGIVEPDAPIDLDLLYETGRLEIDVTR